MTVQPPSPMNFHWGSEKKSEKIFVPKCRRSGGFLLCWWCRKSLKTRSPVSFRQSFRPARVAVTQTKAKTMSKSKNRYDGIDRYVVSQVRYHSHQMLRHYAMAGMEVEDIEQELMLDYLSRIQAFDPEKACRNTFTDRILRNKCAAMIKAAKAEKRNGGFHAASLDSYLEDGDHEDIPESMSIWGSHSNHARQVDLIIDVKDAISMLPKAMRLYCAMLMQDLPIRTLCKIHNRHPSTIYESIGRIRRDFDERGLQKYLH